MRCILSFILMAFSTAVFAASPVFMDNYEEAVSSKNKNVLIVFGTDWCGHCVKLKKELNSLNLDDYVVCVVDAEERKDIRKKYSVSSYPTSIIINNEKEVSRKSGYDKAYKSWLESNRKPFPKEENLSHNSDCKCEKCKPNQSCSCGCSGECDCGFFCWCGCAWSKLFGG